MPDIHHVFWIQAPPERVFPAVSRPEGLAAWWTRESNGTPEVGATYGLDFGPAYAWEGVVRACTPDAAFELELTRADADWQGARIGFRLEADGPKTRVRFHHLGWPEANDHYRISNYCWALYLRLLKRYVEHGDVVPYAQRLEA